MQAIDTLISQFSNETLNSFLRSKAKEFKPRTEELENLETETYESITKLGEIVYSDIEKVAVFSLKTCKHLHEKYNRKAQYETAKKHLKDSDCEAGLFVVYDDTGCFRFSLIVAQYAGTKRNYTTPKRYSFFVSPTENNKTFKQQMNNVDFSSISKLLEAFSTEKVSDDFYEQYKDLFYELHKQLEGLYEKDTKIKAYFEQNHIQLADFAKKTLGQLVFLQFLQKKGWLGVAKGQTWGTGDKNFLQNLFKGEYKSYDNFFNDIVEPLFYQALATQDNRDDNHLYKPLKCKIPFLNGGLFDSLDKKPWEHDDENRIKIPIHNEIFEKIFDTFNQFNFTIYEDEPFEKEVAIDPEMLGKVFERLLEVKDRKSKGAFYTPREIVHYMCQESLIQYLHTQEEALTIEQMGDFIRLGKVNAIKTHAPALDTALATITVCDPAIGSGAFPVGMLHELVRARIALTEHLEPSPKRTPYELKHHAIENCIYGVDIDAGAIEIAKLRFWLALVVDQELEANLHINPLPNMDYKLLCGNSLLGCDLKRDVFTYQNLDALDHAKHAFFNETDAEKKKTLKANINVLKQQLTGKESSFDYHIDFYEVMHGKGGFDVVIGNPPYIRQEELKAFKPQFKQAFSVFNGTADIYTYFYEQGYNILKPNGTLNYITSNKWMRTKYGEHLRGFLVKHTHIEQLVDFGGTQIFDTATVDTNILFFSKVNSPNPQHSLAYGNTLLDSETANTMPQGSLTAQNFTLAEPQVLALKAKIEALGKPLKEWDVNINYGIKTGYNEAFIIDETKRQALLDACQSEDERQRTETLIQPILRGRDIHRWQYKWAGLYIIGTFPALKLDIEQYPSVKAYLQTFGERLKQTGEEYKDSTGETIKTRKKTGNAWFETQDQIAYVDEFKKPKIIYPNMTKFLPFVYDENQFFTNQKCFILTSLHPNFNLKYVVGFLNSSFSKHWIRENCPELMGGTRELSKVFFENIPIPQATEAQQAPLVARVNEILALHQSPHPNPLPKGEGAATATDEEGAGRETTPLEPSPFGRGQGEGSSKARIAELEAEIDVLVYQLYQLTYDDVLVIDPTFAMPRGAYESGLSPTGDLASVKVNATPLFNQTMEGHKYYST